MPGRSPHRHSPPPPPLISRHSPPRRMRSPDRHHLESRGRDRREYRPSVRRSRSPIQTKTRSSYSPPPMKRKVVSPVRERELTRRTKLSKSPVTTRVGSEHGAYVGTSANNDSHIVRSVSGSDRYRSREYEKEREKTMPQFRGPEGSINFDVSELKKFTVEIIRRPFADSDDTLINRTITNPDSIVPVRRPDEGARPLFRRAEMPSSSSRERQIPAEDYRRIVAVASSKSTGRRSPEHSRERSRYPSPPYEDNRRPYYTERAQSPYESRHRSPLREEYIEPKEKHRERRAGSREDLRRDLEVRRREERRYSPERASYERESDLRMRINEKRSEPHLRHEEREYSSRRYESERDNKPGRSHHSPPPREKRRAGSLDRHEVRANREVWEREGERKRRHSREREDRGRERYEHSDHGDNSDRNRRSQPYKTDYEPKKFYKSYEPKEFIPHPSRGRGGIGIHRGIPPVMRGRGIVRGIPARGFPPIRGVMRGVPRVPFMRGFPPRKSGF